jgi:hypothetical protein
MDADIKGWEASIHRTLKIAHISFATAFSNTTWNQIEGAAPVKTGEARFVLRLMN